MIKKTLVATGSLALVSLAVACAPPLPPDQTLGGSPTSAAVSGPTSPTSSTTTSSTTTSSTTTTTTSSTTTIPEPTTTLPDVRGLYSPTPVAGWGIDRTLPSSDPNAETVDVVEIAGSAVYVGGTFQNAREGAILAPRANLMALDLATGDLLPFVANTDKPVRAIAADGASLYIGGDFTTVNGVARNHLAKLNLNTGAVDPTFKAATANTVHDMLVIGGKLYLVGAFNSVDGVARTRAAAVNTTNGGIDPDFKPSAIGTLYAIAASPDQTKLYLAGALPNVLGPPGQPSQPGPGSLVEVDPTTGAVQGPTFERVSDKIYDLSISSDGEHVYAGAKFNNAVDWDADTGDRLLLQRADGDVQAVQYSNGYLYMGFHDGYQGDVALRLLALDPLTSPPGAVDPGFVPASNGYPGVFTLDADGNYLVAGGYFTSMGGVGVRGVAIFPKV